MLECVSVVLVGLSAIGVEMCGVVWVTVVDWPLVVGTRPWLAVIELLAVTS